jgi:hypothetical protein
LDARHTDALPIELTVSFLLVQMKSVRVKLPSPRYPGTRKYNGDGQLYLSKILASELGNAGFLQTELAT